MFLYFVSFVPLCEENTKHVIFNRRDSKMVYPCVFAVKKNLTEKFAKYVVDFTGMLSCRVW